MRHAGQRYGPPRPCGSVWRAGVRGNGGVNVGRTERLISGVAGAGLIGYGLGRRRLRAVLVPLGVGLVRRAVTGRWRSIARSGEIPRRAQAVRARSRVWAPAKAPIEQLVVIGRPRDELFRFWRQLDNLPRFMDNLESVTVLDSRRSHWIAKGPVGTRVEWDAEIHDEMR